jgi:hypothetical protein
MEEQMTDATARYWARRAGWRCAKARGRQHINNKGGYMIVDGWTNNVVYGVNFDLSSTDVVELARGEVYSQIQIADQVITVEEGKQ